MQSELACCVSTLVDFVAVRVQALALVFGAAAICFQVTRGREAYMQLSGRGLDLCTLLC
jgi:hypothetical protein